MKIRPWRALARVLCLLSFTTIALAQGAVTRFSDFNTGPNPTPQGGMSSTGVFFDNRSFFVYFTDSEGAELWVTDGTALNTRLFADICPGSCSSNPQSFYIEGGDLYFAADDGKRGSELWRISAGASAPTFLIDINPGSAGSLPARFERIQFRINATTITRTFFSATRAAEGRELWRLNAGTSPTVALERDILPGPDSSEPRGFEIMNTLQVGLTAQTSVGIREVMALDYTSTTAPASGTTVFTAFTTGAQRRANDELVTLGSNTYLTLRDSTSSLDELWVMQGTNATAVKLFSAGGIVSITPNVTLFRTFFATRESTLRRLMVTDGTVAGTVALGANTIDPLHMTSLGNRLLFTGVTPANGRELFISDGTSGGTVLLKELVTGTGGVQTNAVAKLTANGARLLLGTLDQLWISDGTSAGTIEISGAAIQGTGTINAIVPTTGLESVLSFAAGTSSGGEPFYNRGTAVSTVALGNLRPDVGDSFPTPFQIINQRLIFGAQFPGQTTNAMSLPLTGAGAREDIGDFSNTDSGVHFGRLWFRNFSSIALTDGTALGTTLIEGVRPETRGPECVFERNGAAYFVGFDPSSSADVEIYRTDGTTVGTAPVTDLSTSSSRGMIDDCFPGFHQFAAAGSGIAFVSFNTTVGSELSFLDANDDVTLVADIRSGPASSDPGDLVTIGSRVIFDADDGIFGREVWVSDGSGQGTFRLADINPGVAASAPRDFTREGNRLFFTAEEPTTGRELYVTDGTIAGTRRVTDLFTGTGSAFGGYDAEITAANGKVYFRAIGSADPGCSLFESDGTAAGTRCAYNSASVVLGPPARIEVADNGAVIFSAWRASDGEEIRVLFNGVLATLTGGDVAPGPASSAPQSILVAGNDVFFRANDGATGSELWRLSLGDLDTVFKNSFE